MSVSLLRFSSKIKLVDTATFNNKVKGYPKITEYEGNNIIKSRNAFTDGIIMCNSGGIQDGKKLLLFHFFPGGNTDNASLVKDLESRYNSHKQNKKSCRGLLIGGDSSYPLSIDLKNRLIDLFNRLKIPFSTIWGRNTNTISNVAYFADKDTWFINVHPSNKEKDSILSVDSLNKEFEDIIIDDGDELIAC